MAGTYAGSPADAGAGRCGRRDLPWVRDLIGRHRQGLELARLRGADVDARRRREAADLDGGGLIGLESERLTGLQLEQRGRAGAGTEIDAALARRVPR